jgi:hypothetical protein
MIHATDAASELCCYTSMLHPTFGRNLDATAYLWAKADIAKADIASGSEHEARQDERGPKRGHELARREEMTETKRNQVVWQELHAGRTTRA